MPLFRRGPIVQDEGSSLARRPFINFTGAGVVATDDGANNQTDVTISGGGGGSSVWTEVEKDLGASPRLSGSFTITGAGLTTGKPVQIFQAAAAYTGKGTLTDESEMDQVLVTGFVLNTTTIQCYWVSPTYVVGNFKFNYLVSA